MNKLRLVRSLERVAKECKAVLLVAPKSRCPDALAAAWSGDEGAGACRSLWKRVEPGDLGSTGSTLLSGERLLIAGVLPDTVSRYNSPARAESIRHVLERAELPESGTSVVGVLLDHPDHLLAAANAVGRALPTFTRKTAAGSRSIQLACFGPGGEFLPADARCKRTVDVARRCAELVDTPPSELDPREFARRARSLLKGLPDVRVREYSGDQLVEQGLGGVHAVGRAALSAPRVVIATYKPASSSGRGLALVGKGITYDTGGLHLKARGSMETMKSDMGGAAAVLGAFRVLAEQQLQRPLHLVLCLAENAIGPAAYKPDDILTMHSGKTVEINNTDAEGRLLLADGLSYAARKLKCDRLLDAATLTGAQLIATGVLHAAVISNDAGFEETLVSAGRLSGDLVHPLPFAPEFYRKEFDSPIADLRNSVADRANAQSSCAAEFLHQHIRDTDARWAHIDMAGPAFRKGRATGFGVALVVEAALRLQD